jgi:hypothetical protein
VLRWDGDRIEVTTLVAEPGPLIAMKLQSVMNRAVDKKGTDLLDIVHLVLDPTTRPVAIAQVTYVDASVARDVAFHVDHWFVGKPQLDLRWIRAAAGGESVTADDLYLEAELLHAACARWRPDPR